MKVSTFLFFIFTFKIVVAAGDSTAGKWNAIVRADYGFIIAHRPALEPLQEGHIRGLELSFSRPTAGEAYWEKMFVYPEYGFTMAGFDFETQKLGYGFAVYPFIDFPLGKNWLHKIHFRYGMGLGYIEKTFDPIDNIKNAAISSHL